MSETNQFDFLAVQGVPWRVVGAGWSWPEGCTEACLEWQDGTEATFASHNVPLGAWADSWMDSHDENHWSSEGLPAFLQSDEWSQEATQ